MGSVLASILFIYLSSFLLHVLCAYNPDAGLANNYMLSASLSVSSNNSAPGNNNYNLNNIRDGLYTTQYVREGRRRGEERWRSKIRKNDLHYIIIITRI
jgi:hypothetical protein